MVYDTATDSLEPMTEENCNTEYWDADPDIYKPDSFFEKLKVTFTTLINWFKLLFEYIAANNV